MAKREERTEAAEEGFNLGFVARFRVAPEQSPGVYRQGVGFLKPGDVFTWPDKATPKTLVEGSEFPELLSPKLIPLDDDSHELLVIMGGQRKRAAEMQKAKRAAVLAGEAPVKPVEAPEDRPKKKRVRALTPRQAAAGESEVEEVDDNESATARG